MTKEIRIWKIEERAPLNELKKENLDLEGRLEDWLAQDISILSDDIVLIGRQVETEFGGFIDLLGINQDGDLVIIELKRGRTPRDVVAQILDYGSWVKDLSSEKIMEIAKNFLGKSLDEVFKENMGNEIPNIVNESHQMIIVASEASDSTERIIQYLSDYYGVGINIATFQYFIDENGMEYLARTFLMSPDQVDHRTESRRSSKRKRNLTFDELLEIAESNDVGEFYSRIVKELDNRFDYKGRRMNSIAFKARTKEGRGIVIMSLIPRESNPTEGIKFQIYDLRLADWLGIEKNRVRDYLPENSEDWKYYQGADDHWSGYQGFFSNEEEFDKFINIFKSIGE